MQDPTRSHYIMAGDTAGVISGTCVQGAHGLGRAAPSAQNETRIKHEHIDALRSLHAHDACQHPLPTEGTRALSLFSRLRACTPPSTRTRSPVLAAQPGVGRVEGPAVGPAPGHHQRTGAPRGGGGGAGGTGRPSREVEQEAQSLLRSAATPSTTLGQAAARVSLLALPLPSPLPLLPPRAWRWTPA